jgi:hypothetical protein
MKIELLTSRASAGGSQNRGDVIDVSDDEAKRLIEAGQATPVRSAVKPETATPKRKVEKASW